VADLGGVDIISTQQQAVVDLAVKTKLILDSIDAWLLAQPTLINARKRSLLPAVRERGQLADSLLRLLLALGLERRARKVPDLAEYLRSRYPTPNGGDGAAPVVEQPSQAGAEAAGASRNADRGDGNVDGQARAPARPPAAPERAQEGV
jgi:hypothetical protein